MSSENQDQHEVRLRESNEEKLDDPTLVGNVAKALQEIGGEPAADELESEPTPDDGGSNAEDDATGGDDQAADDEISEPTPNADSNATDGADEEITLPEIPDAYYRSGARYGWSPEDIKVMYDKDPEHTVTMLQNLHQKDNNLTNTFSQLGRKAKELEAQAAAQPTQDAPDLTGKVAKQKVDIEALREKYGDDPLVDMYVAQGEQLNAVIDRLEEVSQQAQRINTQSPQQEAEANFQLEQKINGFFSGGDMQPFVKFYGNLNEGDQGWNTLSVAQRTNRENVLKLADQLLAGARFHGDQMSFDDAMERAHLVVSEPISESITRTKIMKQVEKRHKARVVRPSQSSSTSKSEMSDSKPRTKKELLDRTSERLASLNYLR